MIKAFFTTIFLFATLAAFSQKFISQQGSITFYSDAPVEDIEGVNKSPVSLLDFKTGEVVFLVKVKEFYFDKELMQEHFKEKYIEADKYPKAEFKGNFAGFNPTVKGKQEVMATGSLTIHGVTKMVTAKGIMERKENLIGLKSQFTVKLEDYKISVPQILWQNIAEEILVTVEFIYRPYEK